MTTDNTTPTNTLTDALEEIAAVANGSSVCQPGAAYALGVLASLAEAGPGSTWADVAESLLAAREAHTNRDTAAVLRDLADRVGSELGSEIGGHTSTYSVRRWLREEAAALDAAPATTDNQHDDGLAYRVCTDDLHEHTLIDGWTVCRECGGIPEQPPTIDALGPIPPHIKERLNTLRLLDEANSPERQQRDRARSIANARALDAAEALIPDWQANGNAAVLDDPRAEVWHKCARQLLDALRAVVDGPTTEEKP